MTNAIPVLVVHGVGNRGKEQEFRDRVTALNARIGDKVKLIPVYWGDLAADPRYIKSALPDVDSAEVRGGAPEESALAGDVLELTADAQEVRADNWRIVADAAVEGTTTEVRADGGDVQVRAAVEAAWGELQWLPRVTNDDLLRHVGELVATALAPPTEPKEPSDTAPSPFETRALIETRFGIGDVVDGVKHATSAVLQKVDQVVGDIIGTLGGRLNQALRSHFGPGVVGFFGDVLAYLHDAEAIRMRVREVIQREAPGTGIAGTPIGAIGHSLGGVILFDMAVAEHDELTISTLLTFGSQAPFFHAINRRSTKIATFEGSPVSLPPTIRRWVNLWEPLDVVAFIAANVFKLSDGGPPEDRFVHHELESGVWTHSAYWDLPMLADTARSLFNA